MREKGSGVKGDFNQTTNTKYAIICYAVHDREVVSVDVRETLEEANAFMEEDMKKVYNDEISQNESNENTVEISGNSVTSSGDEEYEWTWDIVPIKC